MSIGKSVPCNFLLCLNFLLELFLHTLCDYMGKKTSSRHFSNCVASDALCFTLFYLSLIKELSPSLLDIFYWYWWSSLLCWQNTLLLTWEILLWGYKERNCWFLMLVYSFNDLTSHIIKNNLKSVMITILGFYYYWIKSCLSSDLTQSDSRHNNANILCHYF